MSTTKRRPFTSSNGRFALATSGNGHWSRTGRTIKADLPQKANGARHLEVANGVWVDLVAEGDAPVEGRIEDDAVVYRSVRPSVDVVQFAAEGVVEDLRVVRAPGQDELSYAITKGPGVGSVRVEGSRVVFADATGSAVIASDPAFAIDARGVRRDITFTIDGDRLRGHFDADGLAYPIVIDPAWKAVAKTSSFVQAVWTFPLGSNRFLTAGLNSSGVMVPSIYDAASDAWYAAGSAASHSLFAQFGDGKILGMDLPTQIDDPATNTWSNVAAEPGSFSAALAIDANRVLGLWFQSGVTWRTYVYSHASDAWTAKANPPSNFGGVSHMTLLKSGKVLVLGNTAPPSVNAAWIYDPSTDAWTPKGAPPGPGGSGCCATYTGYVLPSGLVLTVVEGLTSAWLYDDASDSWTATAALPKALNVGKYIRGSFAELPSKRVFYGQDPGYLYDPVTKGWTTAPTPPAGAFSYTTPAEVASLSDGRVFMPNGSGGAIFTEGASNGSTCAADADCASAHCVDGVCCDTACNLPCQACNGATKGTCSPVTGAPVGGRTCSGTGVCAGTCNGTSSFCTFPPSSTTCSTAGCSGGMLTSAGTCDGAGTCTATAPVACSPYACGATACKTSCASDVDCDATAYCDTSTNKCIAGKKPNGKSCTDTSQCTSGFCEGGFCCDKACTGTCNSCSTGSCTAKTDTPCGATCTGTNTSNTLLCASDGTCSKIVATSCPNNLKCADATSCKASCTTDDDCASGSCSGGACSIDGGTEAGPPVVPDQGAIASLVDRPTVPSEAFQRCSKPSECKSGFCVDGVCCDTACNDKCHSCALPSSPGKCTLSPAGVDLRGECGKPGTCTATCDGDRGQCIGASERTICEANRCIDATRGVGAATCPGPGGACNTEAVIPFDCAPYVCAPAFGACLRSCVSSNDCARGNVCDVTTKTCVPEPTVAPDDSGCAYGSAKARHGGFALFVLGAIALARRAKRVTL